MKRKIGLFLFALLLVVPLGQTMAGSEFSDLDRQTDMVADLLVARPFAMGATVVGSVIYILSYPFSKLGGNEEEAYRRLVVDPATFGFQRPLGEFDLPR